MASYHGILHDTKQRLESPAKVFAKLKAKVQRDLMSAKKDVSTDYDTPRNVRKKYGADCNSPRKRSESIWMVDTCTENHKFGSHRVEVQPVILSPMPSPQKSFGHSFVDIDNKRVGNRMIECGNTFISRLRNGPLLESTAMCAPASVTREQNFSQPTVIRDSDGCKTNRTPMKIPPVLNDRVKNVFEFESAVQNLHMSPAKMYSPMKNRLRKRKADQDFRVNKSTKEISAEGETQTHRRKRSSVLSDDDTGQNTDTEELGGVGGCPTDLLSSPRRAILEKRCIIEKNPLMSPAKIFQYMKEQENKRKQQDVHNVTSSTRELFNGDHNRSELCDLRLPEVVIPLKRCTIRTADGPSQPSEDDVPPDVQAQSVLLEDPLLLDSPCVSIPKKHQAVVKPKKVLLFEKLSNDSVIYLKHWFLRKNPMGLFVDGIHREENIPWNSNIIIKRVSESAVETKSGRVYFLVGKMKMDVASGFPRWFLKKFVNGFPPNWKELYEKFLSESRDRETKKKSEGRNSIVKAASLNVSLQRNRQNACKTPSCPPVSSIKVSRSGRTIKPPLEYWKGGRVILDAHMNVTIHECYNTSICIPEVTTTVSASKSQKPTRVFLPCTEGRTQCESASEEEASAPLRKVKASRRKCNQAKADVEESAPEPVPQKQRESEKASSCRSNKPEHDTSRPSLRERKQTVITSESLTSNDETIQEQSSDEEFAIKRNIQQKGQNRRRRGRLQQKHMLLSSESSEISDASAKKNQKRTRVTKTSGAAQTQKSCNKRSPPTKSLPKSTQPSKKDKANKGHTAESLSPVEHSHSTRSRQTCPATERMLHLDTVLQKQRESEKASTCRSNKPEHGTSRPSLRGRKQTVTPSPESLTSNDETVQEQSSDEEFTIKGNIQQKGQNRRRRGRHQQKHMLLSSESSEISDASAKKNQKKTTVTKTSGAAQTQKSCNKRSPPTKSLPKSTQSSKNDKGHTAASQEQDEDEWTEAELVKLQEAVSYYPKHMTGYWEKVATTVGTRSAAECHHQHTCQGTSQTPAKKARKPRKEKAEAPKNPATDQPVISARAGTLKRKQQVRQFLEAMPKEDVDDVFSSAYMQNKCFEMPSMCPSDDYDFAMSDLEPLTPMAKLIPDVKTPQCLHITPGMMGSPSSNNDDKYVYHLQKRMKKNQFNVRRRAQPLKRFTPTPTVKRTMKRCGNTENNSFVVWEMFPGNEGAPSESEEEDFYFSEND